MKYFDIEELAKHFGRSNDIMRWLRMQENIKPLFMYICKNKHRYFVLPETNLERLSNAIKERENRTRSYWTADSIECWQNNLTCSKCNLQSICKNIKKICGKPPMKWTVINLYKQFGKPYIEKQESEV